MLRYYGLSHTNLPLKEWYDSYVFGNAEVYNPWSVINYVKAAKADVEAQSKAYWSNTSSNSIVRELIERADSMVRQEIVSAWKKCCRSSWWKQSVSLIMQRAIIMDLCVDC